jgi:hypothetical protein
VRAKAEQGRAFYSTLFEKVRALDEAVDAMEEAVAEQQQKRREEEDRAIMARKQTADLAAEKRNRTMPSMAEQHDLPYPTSTPRMSRGMCTLFTYFKK